MTWRAAFGKAVAILVVIAVIFFLGWSTVDFYPLGR